MSVWSWLTRRRDDHGWPGYIINGRIRTSTAALIVAFIAISWLHNTYAPTVSNPSAPETAVVPPGFVPDPAYTWVPRTKVNTPTETTPTTTETSTDTSAPTTTGTATPPTTTSPTVGGPITMVDPDGPGPAPATTLTPSTTTAPTTTASPGSTPTTTGTPGTNPTPMPTQPGGR
jgi:hypothetical protein